MKPYKGLAAGVLLLLCSFTPLYAQTGQTPVRLGPEKKGDDGEVLRTIRENREALKRMEDKLNLIAEQNEEIQRMLRTRKFR